VKEGKALNGGKNEINQKTTKGERSRSKEGVEHEKEEPFRERDSETRRKKKKLFSHKGKIEGKNARPKTS